MAENQADLQAQANRFRFIWAIPDFSFQYKVINTQVFEVGGHNWRCVMFPMGNDVEHLSLYLQLADFAPLPYVTIEAYFSLALIDQKRHEREIRKEARHVFCGENFDWGFTYFAPLSDLCDPSKGYLVKDKCMIEVEVVVLKCTDNSPPESKKETGYVGLKNEGATCYMNSLIQILYLIPCFRKAVYQLPTTNDMTSGSILSALQSIFCKLQYSETSVATTQLTKCLGWDTNDSFMQHDVQDFNRVFRGILDKMKGTVMEGTIEKLFGGHRMNYLECKDFNSTMKESFYDLQLDVEGCQGVYDSFDKYVETKGLEVDYKYCVEGHDFQTARKSILFIDFPPVLALQLMRFEYDFTRRTMVKINDRYEFPLELDLDREGGKYLSPHADKSICNLYSLYSVLVHSGEASGGHYYAFVRPTLSDQWFKFDDERVTKEDSKRALEEQYGGAEELPQTGPGNVTKQSNACMLVYIRESDKERIMFDVDVKDIAEEVRMSGIMYSEVMDTRIVFQHATKKEPEIHTITLPKHSTAEDCIIELKKKVELSHQNAELRLVEVFQNKIQKIFSSTEEIHNINDQYWTLRAEEIPEEERNLGPRDLLIPVCHFCKHINRQKVRNFGDPFVLRVTERELLANVKIRISKKLQVPYNEITKWKFALISLGRLEYLKDTEIVYKCFQGRKVFGDSDHYLGMEHPYTTPNQDAAGPSHV